jgi:transcriptional regulator with XRE-family HTH domain
MRDIGKRLQARARELGFSDAEIARRVGLGQTRYANYVLGIREPDLKTFGRICEVLQTTPSEMMGLDPRATRSAQGSTRTRIDSLLDGMNAWQLGLADRLLSVVASERSEGDANARVQLQGAAQIQAPKSKRTSMKAARKPTP